MGCKLEDGSDSDLYRNGDTFTFSSTGGSLAELASHQGDCEGNALFFLRNHQAYLFLDGIKPTEETKRKVAGRKAKVPADIYREFDKKCGAIVAEIFCGDKSQDVPEPLARIVDWRGGEEVKPLDFVVSNEFGVDYRAVVLEVVSPTQIRTCRGLIGKSHGNLVIIRINTAAIPKQRTMTKAEVEREFGVKVVD